METVRFFSKHPVEWLRITSKIIADRIISDEDYINIKDNYRSVRYLSSEIMKELCKQPYLPMTEKEKQIGQCIHCLHLVLFCSEEIHFCSKTGLACLKKAEVILEKLLQTMTGERTDEMFDETIKLANEIIRTITEFIDGENEIHLQLEEKQAKTA